MTATAQNAAPRSVGSRPPEIEEWLNGRVIHPLSDRLTDALVPTGVTPNMVSAFGVVSSIGAGVFYALPGWPATTLIAFLFHLGWHVFDGSDGDLARRTGKSSPSGEIVDGICDYLSHVAVYAALAWVLSTEIGGWAWLIALAAGVSRAVQANHYESARRTYQWWVYDNPWIRQNVAKGDERPGGWARLTAGLADGYLAVSRWASADDSALVAQHERLMAGPHAQAARALYAARFLPLVKRASLLGALHETQAIFAAMLIGMTTGYGPLYVFVYELVVLNLVMVRSISAQKTANARLAQEMAALA
jgi:phosphatidylglycerophosphate synthase